MDNELLKKLLNDCDVELYGTESVTEGDNKIFRVYITSPKGISLDKCTEVTKIISPILDVNPPISGKYILEVSSPGVERNLKTIEHFKHSVGELVKLKVKGEKKSKNKILAVNGNKIKFYDKDKKVEKEIDFDDIVKAKTYFTW